MKFRAIADKKNKMPFGRIHILKGNKALCGMNKVSQYPNFFYWTKRGLSKFPFCRRCQKILLGV